MLRYAYTAVTLQEVPDEISLIIAITGCPRNCPGCHSPELREDSGTPLDAEELRRLIAQHPGISCVCFFGGDHESGELAELLNAVHQAELKTCLYTGAERVSDPRISFKLDYRKSGPYLKERGGLESPTTNQTFKRFYDGADLTWWFQRSDLEQIRT